jgi:hypothetical protein
MWGCVLMVRWAPKCGLPSRLFLLLRPFPRLMLALSCRAKSIRTYLTPHALVGQSYVVSWSLTSFRAALGADGGLTRCLRCRRKHGAAISGTDRTLVSKRKVRCVCRSAELMTREGVVNDEQENPVITEYYRGPANNSEPGSCF